MKTKLTATLLRSMWPKGDSKVPGLIAGIAAAAPTVFAKYGANSDLVIAHAMAQFSHECGAGTEMVENINYTAERAAEVWPLKENDKAAYRHFANAADCYKKTGSFAGDPQFKIKLIDLVYGTRMGNRPGTHDGSRYIGRSLSQCTGLEGYARLQKATGLPLLDNPEMVCLPQYALECGVADFVACGCLPFAQRDDVENVTLHLNGGHIGLAERKEWLTRWKIALAKAPIVDVADAPPIAPPVAPPVAPSTPAPADVQKPPVVAPKNVATGAVVVAGTTAAKVAHSYSFSSLSIVAIVAGTAIVAAAVWWAMHRRAS